MALLLLLLLSPCQSSVGQLPTLEVIEVRVALVLLTQLIGATGHGQQHGRVALVDGVQQPDARWSSANKDTGHARIQQRRS